MSMTETALTPELQVLLDKQAIYDAMMRYCRGVDRCDEDLMRSIFHGDARAFDTSAWEFVKHFVPDNRAATTFTVHAIANMTIEVEGDRAFSEAYFITYAGRDEGGREVVDAFCGRYVDRWERRGGNWGVTLRQVAQEWSRGNAFGTEVFPVPSSEDGTFRKPVRGHDDISYQR
jgi:SnoaL-like domain